MKPAGKRRHRVIIQHDTATTYDAAGQPVTTNATFATRWASVEPLTGRELWDAQQVRPNITHRVTMLYLPGVNTRMKLVHRDRTFNIESIANPEERNIELEILCTEAL